jgi:hypothetical protein
MAHALRQQALFAETRYVNREKRQNAIAQQQAFAQTIIVLSEPAQATATKEPARTPIVV